MDTTITPTVLTRRSLASLTPPPSRAPKPIDRSKILVIAKRTKIECDMQRMGKTYNQILEWYDQGSEDKSRIVASHARQLAVREKVIALLSPEQVIFRDDLKQHDIPRASLVVALGGDNHFQYVSQLVEGETPVLGLNSDPKTSFGALLSYNVEQFETVLKNLVAGIYSFAPWTRLDVEINGKRLPPAMCDLFLGETERKYMSRHTLTIRTSNGSPLYNSGGRGIEQKSSGVLISTGAGSTSWIQAAGRYIFPEGLTYPKTERRGMFLLTEASNTHPGGTTQAYTLPALSAGDFIDGEELVFTSLNDSGGMVSADSTTELPFPRGAKAVIRLAKEPLWVIAHAA